jgi:hypothetical protein
VLVCFYLYSAAVTFFFLIFNLFIFKMYQVHPLKPIGFEMQYEHLLMG